MGVRLAGIIGVVAACGGIAAAASADAPAAPAPPAQATADAAALALVGNGTPRLASLPGVDVYGRVAALSTRKAVPPTKLAFACWLLSCSGTASGTITLYGTGGQTTTTTLPAATVHLQSGAAGLVTLRLTAAQQKIVHASTNASLHLTVSAATTYLLPQVHAH